MKRKQICALSAISTAVISAFAVSVASAQEVTSLEQTEPVKVTASRVEQELMDVNMSISVITEDQIRHSGARSVAELLQNVPGVQIDTDGGQGSQHVYIRGEDSFHTLVMIDGQKLSDQKSMSGPALLIDPAMIERIEVIKGPASVLYGSDAIGGVVNIITKKGGDKPFQGAVSTGFNTSSSGKNAAASLFGAKDGWKYRLSASIQDNDNIQTPKGEMPNTYFSSKSVAGFLSYDVTPDVTIGSSLDYYDLEFGATSIVWPNSDFTDFSVDVPKWTRTKGAIFADVRNISKYLTRLRTDAWYQRGHKTMTNTVGNGPMYVWPLADNKQETYGFSAQSDWKLGASNYLIAGYEFSYDKIDANSTTLSTMTPPGYPTGYMGNKDYDGYQMTNAVYASMESLLPHDFTLNYGARYTWVKNDVDTVDNIKPVNNSTGSNSDGKAVVNAGILWHGIDKLVLRANYSQGYRSPLLQDLYIGTVMGGQRTEANADLKSETSDNFEIGARWNSQSLKADWSFFYNKADDYITRKLIGRNIYQYANIAKATTFGSELSLSYKFVDNGFEPYTSLTWMRRQFDHGNGFETYDSGTPELMIKYGLRWSGERAGLGLRSDVYAVSHTASKMRESADGKGDYRLPGFTTLNWTAGVSFGPQKQYSLDAGLYNILDQAYLLDHAIYQPGRYAAVKLNARF